MIGYLLGLESNLLGTFRHLAQIAPVRSRAVRPSFIMGKIEAGFQTA